MSEEQRQSEIFEALLAQEMDAAWRSVLSSQEGRLVLWSILEMAGVFRETFSTNQAISAFSEGRRHIGLSILKDRMLPFDPSILGALMAENTERLARIERELEREHEID